VDNGVTSPTADQGELERARSRVVEFEQIIYQAVSEIKHLNAQHDEAERQVRENQLLAWRLEDLFDSYGQSNVYPLGRLPGVADRAIDLKLQLYFVSELNIGIYHTLLFGTDLDLRNPQSTPRHHLTHLCLMQSWIGQLRVLWERLMTLVYFLEEGKDPRGKLSIRKQFFRGITSWGGRWDVFAEWESFIDQYDKLYRTPEYHNRSSMRKALFGDPSTDPNSIMAPLDPVIGGFWDVLMANVQGVASPVKWLGRKIDPVLGPAWPPGGP
jgi:hypothetical protein